ncbi:MAG: heme exporter protein CcmB [Robiginitomaculum sp.]
MQAFNGIIKRDFTIALRSGGAWLHGLVFFGVFLTLCAIALGGDFAKLRPLAPALIWLSVILSLLLSFEQLFKTDTEDGTLEHIKLSGTSLFSYTLAKCCVHWVLVILPLLISLPLASLLFDLPLQTTSGLFFSILIASPALICYGAFSSACLVSFKAGGTVLALLTVPIILPLLIFGISGVNAYENAGLMAIEFQALTGISLIAIALGIPATAAALNVLME